MKFSRDNRNSNKIMMNNTSKKVSNASDIERAPSVKPLLPPKPSTNNLVVSNNTFKSSKSESTSPTNFPTSNCHSNGQVNSDIPPIPVRSRDSTSCLEHRSHRSSMNNSSHIGTTPRTKSVSPTQQTNSIVNNDLYSPYQPSIPPRNELFNKTSVSTFASRPKTPPRNGNSNRKPSLTNIDSNFCTVKRGDSTVSSGASSTEFLPLTAPRKSLNKVSNKSIDFLHCNSSTEFSKDDLSRLSVSESCMSSSAILSSQKMSRKVFLDQIEQFLNQGDPRKWLYCDKQLPYDSASQIWLAENTRCPAHSPQRQVIVKKTCYSSAPRLQNLYNEVAILRLFPHEHIIKIYGIYLVNNEVWFAMEYAANGTLSDILQARREPLSEEQIVDILHPIVSALAYLHSNGIVHRDIRSDSILIMTDGSAKLSDFSLSAQIYPDIPKRKTLIGSPYWMAPEIIARWPYDCSVDIWSLGITVLEMLNGEPPNYDQKPCDAMAMVRDKKIDIFVKPGISSNLKDFLDSMLQYYPAKRATAADLLASKFLKQAKLKRGSSLQQSLN